MQKITQCWLILKAFPMAGPGMLWEPSQSLLTPLWQCPGNALWLCSVTCPTMDGCYYCLKELIERISSWTPLSHQLRWVISNRVYPIFSDMSCLTLIPGRPGPPSCPRSPAGPLGPGGPGLPRSPAGPWIERWRFTARESTSCWVWNCPSKFTWILQKFGGLFWRKIYTFSPGSPLLPGKPRKPGEPCQMKNKLWIIGSKTQAIATGFSFKLFTIRLIIMKINWKIKDESGISLQ